jgi:hypothetical protein
MRRRSAKRDGSEQGGGKNGPIHDEQGSLSILKAGKAACDGSP